MVGSWTFQSHDILDFLGSLSKILVDPHRLLIVFFFVWQVFKPQFYQGLVLNK